MKKTKKKGFNFIIDLVVFPFDIMFSIGESDEDLQKNLKNNIHPSCYKDIEDMSAFKFGATTKGRTVNLETSHQTIIRLPSLPAGASDNGTVAHEILHAVSFILWRMGIPFEIEKTDEVYAYLIGYVTTKFYDKLKAL